MSDRISARVIPQKALEVLSQIEVARLAEANSSELYDIFRRCALAVLNTGSQTDSTKEVLDAHKDFAIRVVAQERGVKLDVENAPACAFVDGDMIAGIQEHLYSVLRDIVYINNELKENRDFDFSSSAGITNGVFHILRNAGLLATDKSPNVVVCWGGHSIGPVEYDYSKEVGYELGLRSMDICTGCGPGAMKGPMKGATIAHAKQRWDGRYIGITEPGIIAAESPNPIVNKLIIMPDIEKRLEAFVRVGHGIVVFPGGVGTAEEILYILSLLLNPKNNAVPFPLVFTGPAESEEYFKQIDQFIASTLGPDAQKRYKIIIDDPVAVARHMKEQLHSVKNFRRSTHDAYYFNWVLDTAEDVQQPFVPTHDNMAALNLHKDQSAYELAVNLRKAFSGIVDGNVKEHGIQAIAEKGPYELSGDDEIMKPLSALLESFVKQKRMKIPTSDYVPCYKLV
ncbi:nucleotide 5'-monophosphate nucleosidase PpnN [Agaribacterium haliotis]|uniref:nucleotide 5'-monophosphate nucleosidase PpnN n=1 Tax=Agaribacterium haliotis TaxID=2013869 RepID=UPI000BB53CC9|nr:nucleotide 5'-monophosphate nucleosidase PpnN [Agaribacterium haliotis]